MSRSVLLALLIALVGAAFGGCGDDASTDDDESRDGGSPDAGRADATDGSGGGGGSGSTRPTTGGSSQSVECGSTTCTAPQGGFAMACCADESTGTCGMSVMGNACSKPVAGDERCPSVSIMGALMLPSCCSPEGMCGIDPSMFGMPGCVDLESAAMRSGMMGGGFTIMFPEPRRCDGSDDGDDDDDSPDEGDDGDGDDGDDSDGDDSDGDGDADAGTDEDAGM